jgi:hypothetical protein
LTCWFKSCKNPHKYAMTYKPGNELKKLFGRIQKIQFQERFVHQNDQIWFSKSVSKKNAKKGK